MATLTIRNLDETVKRGLQVRAALNGRSMEAEARDLLSGCVTDMPTALGIDEDLGTAIHKRFASLGGVDLEIPAPAVPMPDSSAPGKKVLGQRSMNSSRPLVAWSFRFHRAASRIGQIPTFE